MAWNLSILIVTWRKSFWAVASTVKPDSKDVNCVPKDKTGPSKIPGNRSFLSWNSTTSADFDQCHTILCELSMEIEVKAVNALASLLPLKIPPNITVSLTIHWLKRRISFLVKNLFLLSRMWHAIHLLLYIKVFPSTHRPSRPSKFTSQDSTTITHIISTFTSSPTVLCPSAASSLPYTEHAQPQRKNKEHAQNCYRQPCVSDPGNCNRESFSDKCQIFCFKCQLFKSSRSHFGDCRKSRRAETALKFVAKYFDKHVLGNGWDYCSSKSSAARSREIESKPLTLPALRKMSLPLSSVSSRDARAGVLRVSTHDVPWDDLWPCD